MSRSRFENFHFINDLFEFWSVESVESRTQPKKILEKYKLFGCFGLKRNPDDIFLIGRSWRSKGKSISFEWNGRVSEMHDEPLKYFSFLLCAFFVSGEIIRRCAAARDRVKCELKSTQKHQRDECANYESQRTVFYISRSSHLFRVCVCVCVLCDWRCLNIHRWRWNNGHNTKMVRNEMRFIAQFDQMAINRIIA